MLTREGYINYEYTVFLHVLLMAESEIPPVPVSFQKVIASSGIVLISLLSRMTHSCFIVAHFLMFLISQFACVKILQKLNFKL